MQHNQLTLPFFTAVWIGWGEILILVPESIFYVIEKTILFLITKKQFINTVQRIFFFFFFQVVEIFYLWTHDDPCWWHHDEAESVRAGERTTFDTNSDICFVKTGLFYLFEYFSVCNKHQLNSHFIVFKQGSKFSIY